jgi:histone family protein DNA-binding protein
MKNKREISKSMATDLGYSNERSKEAVEYIFAKVSEFLAEDEKVQLIGFGSFEVRNRAKRKGRNPQTGKPITIEASKAPVFRAGTALKELVNK